MSNAFSLRCIYISCKVLYFILSDDDFEIKSKIYSFNLRLVLKHILHSQDVFFRNLLFTLLNSPMLKVGPTVKGLNSLTLQQNLWRSFSCLSFASTQNGSAPILTSRINAVFLHLACALHSCIREYQGSFDFEEKFP